MSTDEWIEESRRRRRRHIEEIAPLVDARLKDAARSAPHHLVGVWRGKTMVDTNPPRSSSGKPVSAAELARYKVVFAHDVCDEVFALCHTHGTAYTTHSQGDARSNGPETWCPGCTSDPSWPPGVANPAVVAAEDRARQQRVEKIKASRKTRIAKVTQIAVARGVVSEQQAEQLLAIWREIQSAQS
ncbi:hypothetical protein [Mycolicibacterium brisbanense]